MQPPSSRSHSRRTTRSMAVTPSGAALDLGRQSPRPLRAETPPAMRAGARDRFEPPSSRSAPVSVHAWRWIISAACRRRASTRQPLRDGSRTPRLAPMRRAASDLVRDAPAACAASRCQSDGAVASADDLGHGSVTTWSAGRTPPVLIAGLTDVIAIAAGPRTGLAVRSNGSVSAWGTDLAGQALGGSTLIEDADARHHADRHRQPSRRVAVTTWPSRPRSGLGLGMDTWAGR